MTIEDLTNIALEVTGMTKARWSELSEAMKSDATMNMVMKEEWNAKPRDSEEAIREYYRESEIWFMNTFNHGVGALVGLASGAAAPLAPWQTAFVSAFVTSGLSQKILDYGGGLLKDSWPLVSAGHHVTLAEVRGPVTTFLSLYRNLAGLRHRFEVLEVDSDLPIKETYDGVICFETLEHLLEPVALTGHIHEHLRPDGPFAFSVSFGDTPHAPYHVAKNAALGSGRAWFDQLDVIGFRPYWWEDGKSLHVWRRA